MKLTKDKWNHIYKLVGASMEVYNHLGRGLNEKIYQEALAIEFDFQKINYVREKELNTYYKGVKLNKTYIPDFISDDIVIELKSEAHICSDNRAQLFNYLRLSKLKIGLLINYGETSLRCERFIYNEDEDNFILINKDNYKSYIENL